MANKVKFNIQNVHYAVLDDAQGTYGTPVHIPGAVSLTTDPTGDDSIFWADGVKYYVAYNNTGYEGDFEVALLPDSFRIDVLGDVLDSKNVLVEKADAPTVKFALGFQIDGDKESTFFWYYNCAASRPSSEANTTEESKDPETDTLNWTCAPGADGIVRVKTTAETAAADTSAWFEAVYIPDLSEGNNEDPNNG